MGTTLLHAARDAVVDARRFVASHAVDEEVSLSAQLLVSELVTTCLRHADGGDVELTVRVVNGVFRVDVARRGGERAVRIDDDGFLDETGVGMEILNALAERWGIERGHGEWRAWFELAAATAAPPPTPDR